jgi:hypothetical protein
MPEIKEILFKDIPKEVIDNAMEDLRQYSVGFVRMEFSHGREDAVLLGSGTLVSIGPTHAVLTADHVLRVLPNEGRLGMILAHHQKPTTFDIQGISYLKIARGTIDADGPDLGAVILAPSIAGSIAAQKTFYNLDLRRDQMLNSPPDLHDGFWFVNGYIDEYTMEGVAENGGLIKRFYNLSAAGSPDRMDIVGDFDFFDFPVETSARLCVPESFGGMSGGGLWQVPLKLENGKIIHRFPLLSGVVFYQEPTTVKTCGVRCHGRQSVYRVANDSIQKGLPHG